MSSSSTVKTFWCEPTGLFRHSICVMSDGPCGLCSARKVVADCVDYAHELPRLYDDGIGWPRSCDSCGTWLADPRRSSGSAEYYSGAPDGEIYVARELPPGALWDAEWWGNPGPDGITLCVMLPNGLKWMPDSPPSGRRGETPWTRTGDPRSGTVTVHPSIAAGRSDQPHYYHGYLTNGELVALGDSRA